MKNCAKKNRKKYQTERKKKYSRLKLKKKLKARKAEKRAAAENTTVPVVNQDPPTCAVAVNNTGCSCYINVRRPKQKWTIEEEAMLKVIEEENQRTTVESFFVEQNGVLPPPERHAKALEDTLNNLEGVTCGKTEEGMILFPRIQFPLKAIKAAEAAQTAPDAFYARRLLKATGIVVFPGSDFGHVPGIWFVGLSILLQQEEISVIIRRLADFHQAFMVEFHE